MFKRHEFKISRRINAFPVQIPTTRTIIKHSHVYRYGAVNTTIADTIQRAANVPASASFPHGATVQTRREARLCSLSLRAIWTLRHLAWRRWLGVDLKSSTDAENKNNTSSSSGSVHHSLSRVAKIWQPWKCSNWAHAVSYSPWSPRTTAFSGYS